MPRQNAKNDMPRRRGAGAKAVAVDADAERGLVMRMLLHSPKDMIAGVLAFAAVSAIITNALFLQAGRHPSPMFGSVVALSATGSVSASPLPRPRPVDAMTRPAEPSPADPKPAEPKAADTLANLVKSSSAPAVAPSNTAQAAGSRRVAAVQRALTEYGYGQLKPTGTVGSDTQAAIQKFERERKIPVTGQVSDRLVRELAAVTGRPVE
ncbi:MAG TPA: peptidoglycan-binding domain-containing protein [Bradyrhizobium sp.]|nr:peptidoglycan-binding domain-containing protein [Bradyrhizobium sp.]